MSRAQLTSTDQQNSGGPVSPFVAGKNKIINGDFNIWQRGTTFSPTNASQFYLADRWCIYQNGSGTFTVSQQAFDYSASPAADKLPIAGYTSAYFTRLAITTLGTTSAFEYEQKIEDVKTFANQIVTISFWGKSPTSTGIGFYYRQNFGSGGSSNVQGPTQSFTLTTSWQRFSYTVTLPSIVGKTIGAGNNLEIIFNASTSANETWDIWGVQVEAGSVATPFTTASNTFQGELALCERYYWRVATGANQPIINMAETTTTTAEGVIQYPVTMRTTPTLDQSTGNPYFTFLHAGIFPTFNNFVIDLATPNVAMIYTSTLGSSGTAGHAGMAYTNNANAYFGFQAEL
jgi:hypothetical protein